MKGFTFLELILALATVTIASAIALTRYDNFEGRSRHDDLVRARNSSFFGIAEDF